MNIIDFLSPNSVLAGLKPSSKKQAFLQLSELISRQTNIDEDIIFDLFNDREKLGSTNIGGGVAIPHIKSEKVSGISCYFLQFAKAVDFDAPDEIPVDLLFAIVAPENSSGEHLKLLAKVNRLFRMQRFLEQLRGSDNAEALHIAITQNS